MNPRIRIATVSAVAAGLLALLMSLSASASVPYPEELRAALNLSYTPSCSLCHRSGSDASTWLVDTPFGKSMVARGLRAATPAELNAGFNLDGGTLDSSLVAALKKMRADGVDSDGDGAEDLDELAWQSDPNNYDGLKANPTPPVNYGCQLTRRPSIGAAIFVGLAILSLRRFRAKGPGRSRH